MKNILILLLSIISLGVYGQTTLNPLGSNTVSNINDANTKPTAVAGTDTYTATLPGTGYATGSAFFTYITDRVITFKFANAAGAGPWTLDVNGQGAKTLKKKDASGTIVDIVSTDIPAANTILPLRYNGTYFVLEGGVGGGGSVTSVSGTANQIASSGGTTPVISIVTNPILPGAPTIASPGNSTQNIITTDATQTLSNKTLVAPALGTIASGDGASLSNVVNSVTGDGVGGTSDNPVMDITSSRIVTSNSSIVQGDNLHIVYLNSSSTFNFTLDALTANSQVVLINVGSATVTLLNGSGVTFVGSSTIPADASAVVIYKTSTAPLVRSGSGSSSSALANGHIFVGNASNVATDVSMSGDVTISNTGVTAIGSAKVTNAMLAGLIDLTAKVTGILPEANGGTGSTAGAILKTGTTVTGGIQTLQSNTANGLVESGVWTATANNQYFRRHVATVTARATASDELYGDEYIHTLVAGAASQTLATLKVKGLFTPGAFSPTMRTAWFTGYSGGAALYVDSDAGTQIMRITNAGVMVLGSSGDPTTITAGTRVLTFGGTSDWGANAQYVFQNGGNSTGTSGTVYGFRSIGGGFTPTAGSVNYIHSNFNYSVNQTSTSSGNATGLLISSTLTSVKGKSIMLDIDRGSSATVVGADIGFVSRYGMNGIRLGTSDPSASLHIAASTTAAGTGQIKLAEGVNLTTPEDGNINYVSNNITFTETSTVYTLAKTLTNTATLDFGSTAAGTATDLTITVTGAVDGDPVSVGVPNASTLSDGDFSAWVSATNTVTVRFANNSLVSALDPASGTFRVSVTHY